VEEMRSRQARKVFTAKSSRIVCGAFKSSWGAPVPVADAVPRTVRKSMLKRVEPEVFGPGGRKGAPEKQ